MLLEAKRIEQEAWARKERLDAEASEKHGKPLIDPMLDFQTAENAQIMQAYDTLKADYTVKHHLNTAPILLPAAPARTTKASSEYTPHIPQRQSYNSMYKHSDTHALPEELKNTFLHFIPTFRDRERLYIWMGNHYRYLSDNEVKAKIKTILHSELYVPNPTTLLNNILFLLKVEENISGTPDSFPNLIAVQNGEIDLDTLQLSPSSPSHHLTHYLDVPWAGWQPCPVFNHYLEHVAGGDPELILRIWETIGFLLVSDNRAKRFAVFQGEGDCGKSLLCNLLTSYFEYGDFSSLADYQFGERFSLSFMCCICKQQQSFIDAV